MTVGTLTGASASHPNQVRVTAVLSVPESEAVTFTAAASGALSPYTYAWDLGGTPASGATVTHAFAVGTYTVTLTVTDAAGFEATTSQSLTVTGAGAIFVDGFESGTTSAWSVTVPLSRAWRPRAR